MAADFVQMDLLAWGADSSACYQAQTVEPQSFAAEMKQQIAARDGVNEKCRHLSIWNKHVCNKCGDCGEIEEFTDGITSDQLETIELPLPKKIKDTAKVSLACGNSGKWYCGWSAHSAAKQEGVGFAAFPKFSATHASKYEAFTAAAEAIQGWFTTRTQPANLKAIVQELKLIAQKLDPDQYERDTTCDEWRACGYAEQCFNQSLDDGPGPVCFKDQHTEKSKQAAEISLSELCKACHAASFCAGCCVTCKEPCNAAQNCRWPGAE